MRIEITGHQIDITSALREYVHTKLDRLERHFENLIDIHVILTVEKLDHEAEATIQISGRTLFAEVQADNMYTALDLLADKLDRQVLKHKEKMTDHHRGEAASRSASFG